MSRSPGRIAAGDFIKRRHLVPIAIWFACYMALFGYLEINPPQDVHIISCGLDGLIPHIPAFIYPYLSWFPYICICVFFALRDMEDGDFKKAVFVLVTGMNIFLFISYVWPTGLTLREGIVYDTSVPSGLLMKFVQGVDVPKSVFPSMHVYVTLVLQYTLELQKGKRALWGIWLGRIVALGIVLSTMFTKQHSAVDVAGAIIMFGVLAAGYSLAVRPASSLAEA